MSVNGREIDIEQERADEVDGTESVRKEGIGDGWSGSGVGG